MGYVIDFLFILVSCIFFVFCIFVLCCLVVVLKGSFKYLIIFFIDYLFENDFLDC